jgi:hypothetical protein
MGKNHGQNTRTIWPERPSPTATLPLLISSGYRTRRAGISCSAPYLIPFRPIRREHYRSEYPPGTKITGPRIHSTRSRETRPAPAAGKSPLHQVRASPGREPGPSSLSPPVNSNYPAAGPPRATTGAPGALPENLKVVSFAPNSRTTTAIEWSHPAPSPGGYLPDAPGCLRDSPRHLPESRDAWGPAAWPARAAEPTGGDGGRRRVRVRGRLAGRPARRDMIDTTRIGDRRPRPGPIFRPGPQDHQPPDISSSNGLKCRSPIFVAPEAIGPEDQ